MFLPEAMAPAPAVQLAPRSDINRNLPLQARVEVVLPLTATIGVLIRLWLRRKYKVNLWFDDALIVVPVICAWCLWGIWTWVATNILTNPTLPAPEAISILKKLCIGMDVFYGSGINIVKFSFLLFYLRSFGTTQKVRWCIFVLLGIVGIFTIVKAVETALLCIPICLHKSVPGYSVLKFYIAMRAANWTTEVLILIFPIPILWRMRITPKQKFAIIAVFSLGIITCIASALRLYYLLVWYKEPQNQWKFGPNFLADYYAPQMSYLTILALVELNLAILTATLPAIRSPAVQFVKSAHARVFKGRSSRSALGDDTPPIPSARTLDTGATDTNFDNLASVTDEKTEKIDIQIRETEIA